MIRFLALSLAAAAAQACELPGAPAQRVQAQDREVVFRTQPAVVKVGEHFAVDFVVCPAPDAVRVDAWMPEHRHGMNYRPSIAAQGGGRYRAEGLMFHMAGRWEFVFELRGGGATERLAHSVRIE
jgi:hypothetical protein